MKLFHSSVCTRVNLMYQALQRLISQSSISAWNSKHRMFLTDFDSLAHMRILGALNSNEFSKTVNTIIQCPETSYISKFRPVPSRNFRPLSLFIHRKQYRNHHSSNSMLIIQQNNWQLCATLSNFTQINQTPDNSQFPGEYAAFLAAPVVQPLFSFSVQVVFPMGLAQFSHCQLCILLPNSRRTVSVVY